MSFLPSITTIVKCAAVCVVVPLGYTLLSANKSSINGSWYNVHFIGDRVIEWSYFPEKGDRRNIFAVSFGRDKDHVQQTQIYTN